MEEKNEIISRREFIKRSAGIALGLTIIPGLLSECVNNSNEINITKSKLNLIFKELLGDKLYDFSVIKPPKRLKGKYMGYSKAYSKGYEIIKDYNSVIVFVLFSDVAADYYINEIFTPSLDKYLKKYSKENKIGYKSATEYYHILRKEMAYFAGLGKIGKNALIFSNKFGFNCKIDMIATTLKFDEYYYQEDMNYKLGYCSNCNICIAECPVSAFQNYEIQKKHECDNFIHPNFFSPEKSCRRCITACLYSNDILVNIQGGIKNNI